MTKITIHVPPELAEQINEDCGYGSRSEWFREAARLKLGLENDDESEVTPATNETD